MYNREKDQRDLIPVPKDLESFHEELGSIKWISSSIKDAERIPSCKRRDALISALTTKLEGDNHEFSDYTSFLSAYHRLKEMLQSREHEISSLRKELSERPTQFLERPIPPELPDSQVPPLEAPQQKGSSAWIWIMLLLIIGSIVYYLNRR